MSGSALLCASPRVRPSRDVAIRVLVVDGSAVTRAVLQHALGACPDIAVVGQAPSAARALAMLDAAGADVVVLDLGGSAPGGLAALPLFVRHAAAPVVLVLSVAGESGGAAARQALRLGAAEVLSKPNRSDFGGAFPDRLADTIRRLAPRRYRVSGESAEQSKSVRPAILGVAASTGGVPALIQLSTALPADFDVPILVTQHLPGSFLPFFVDQLRNATGRAGRVAETGMVLRPGEFLVAPGDAHLALARTGTLVHVRLETGPAASGCRPSADPMFASLARLFGASAAGVVLSGMGRDGAEGAAQLAVAGAAVYAQDAASSVVWGMPGVVARNGTARAVLPPKEIALALAGEKLPKAGRWN